MKIQLIRHATLLLQFGGKRILADPMFSPAGVLPTTPNTPNPVSNPLVELPIDPEKLTDVDAILVTHLHRDHLDDAAVDMLPKDVLLLCQPEDEQKLREWGFTAVMPVPNRVTWGGIEWIRTGGQHGTGDIGKAMAPVSGFVLKAPGEGVLYIAGDTIWCEEVSQALDEHRPDVTVVNAGAAQFLTGDPITMTAEDVSRVAAYAPATRVVAVHLEAWNHCLLSRQALRAHVQEQGLAGRVIVPADGEILHY